MVPARVDEFVDPLHPHRTIPLGLDRERWGIVDHRVVRALGRDGPIAPHDRRRKAGGQDLLGELPHGDLVDVDRLAAARLHRARPRHHRGNQQRRLELRNVARQQRATGDLRQCHARAARPHRVQHEPGSRRPGRRDERAPTDRLSDDRPLQPLCLVHDATPHPVSVGAPSRLSPSPGRPPHCPRSSPPYGTSVPSERGTRAEAVVRAQCTNSSRSLPTWRMPSRTARRDESIVSA